MKPMEIYPIIVALHNIATAIWIGGMFALIFAVYPSLRQSLGKSKDTKKYLKEIMENIKKKLSLWVYISFIILFITGLLLAKQSGQTTGKFIDFSTLYTTQLAIKHILYFVVIIISVLRSRVIDHLKNLPMPKREKLNMILLLLNFTLGIIILILTANLEAIVKFSP
ncbi:MAG: hypothetical protein ACTSU2_10350 [Promethearchaeota archaeon]